TDLMWHKRCLNEQERQTVASILDGAGASSLLRTVAGMIEMRHPVQGGSARYSKRLFRGARDLDAGQEAMDGWATPPGRRRGSFPSHTIAPKEERRMFGLSKLTAAVNNLAANLTALAETVGQVNTGVRWRLGLDGGETALGLPEPALAEGG